MTPAPLLILGAGGMLGHKLFQILRPRFPGTLGLLRAQPRQPPLDRIPWLQGDDVIGGVEVLDRDRLAGVLAELRPACIVNCVGLIKQHPLADEAARQIALNGLLPWQLAGWAAKWGGRVIHFSTDCVFDGRRGDYREEDAPDATDLYGRTKALGEVKAPNALTLRSSIIGRELSGHRGLLDWLLAQAGGTVPGFQRAIYSGLTTLEMAELLTLLRQNQPELTGLYQVAGDAISKYELLRHLRDAYGLQLEIVPDARPAPDRSLRGERFRAATGYVAPAWPVLVRHLADDPTPYAAWGMVPA